MIKTQDLRPWAVAYFSSFTGDLDLVQVLATNELMALIRAYIKINNIDFNSPIEDYHNCYLQSNSVEEFMSYVSDDDWIKALEIQT